MHLDQSTRGHWVHRIALSALIWDASRDHKRLTALRRLLARWRSYSVTSHGPN